MRKTLKIVFSILVLSGIGVWILPFDQNARLNRKLASHEVKPVESDSTLTAREAGTVLVYDFSREIQSQLIEQGRSKPFVDLHYEGRFQVTPIQKGEHSVWNQVQFELQFQNQKDWIRSTRPFFVELGENFEIKKIRAEKPKTKVERDELNVIRDFVSLYAFRTAEDTMGAYLFDWKPEQGGGLKSKKTYTGNWAKQIRILQSRHEVKLDLAGRPTLIQGSEQTETRGEPQSGLKMSGKYSIQFKEQKEIEIKPGEKDRLASLPSLSIGIQGDALTLNAHPYEELLPTIKKIPGLSRSERLAVFHELVSSLRMDPSKITDFKKLVESMKDQEGFLEFGVGALATVGGETAELALQNWYQELGKDKPLIKHTILNAFATTDVALTANARGFLLEAASAESGDRSLSENAAFALGSSLRRVSDSGVEMKLESLYRSAQDPGLRESYLDAMGNSGDAHFVPTLLQALQSENVEEREKAAFAARLLRPSDAAPVLLRAFQDSSPKVKSASIRALAYQTDLHPYAGLVRECASQGNSACVGYLERI